jgi:hypothetical protein
MIADSQGNYLFVLDHDSPSSAACALELGAGVTACGDVSVFKIDPTTGRLSTVVNAQVTSASGVALPYFPVPANPIDFLLNQGFLLTVSGTPTTGDAVFPLTYNQTNGQLTVNQNSAQPLSNSQTFNGLVDNATAIVAGGTIVYVLDNEPITVNGVLASESQILPYSVGGNGSLQTEPSGAVPDDSALANPVALYLEYKGKWLYVANQGNNNNPSAAQSGIVGYDVFSSPTYQLTPITNPGGTVGTGAGPQCLVEDPSNQFMYTANFNDSTVTGRAIDQNDGVLDNLPGSANHSYSLAGPAAWCVVTGRTS